VCRIGATSSLSMGEGGLGERCSSCEAQEAADEAGEDSSVILDMVRIFSVRYVMGSGGGWDAMAVGRARRRAAEHARSGLRSAVGGTREGACDEMVERTGALHLLRELASAAARLHRRWPARAAGPGDCAPQGGSRRPARPPYCPLHTHIPEVSFSR